MIKRLLAPPKNKSFFLFGPRGVGKSTWMKEHFSKSLKIDLLENRTYLELMRDPGLLEAKTAHLNEGEWVYIDEIQRIPELLTEVHRLIEERKLLFALTGSSARKLKRNDSDLLGGRALRKLMEPLSFSELKASFSLKQYLNWGGLPLVYLDPENALETLDAYFNTYLKEEIKEEGLVRKLDPFLRFLEVTSILNAQQINGDSIAREAKIPRSSIDGYFSILEDTLVGHLLPAFQPKAKVKEHTHPKFYWFDCGVARACANLLSSPLDPQWLGSALETYLFHELRTYNHCFKKMKPLSYYRTTSGLEIDFVIEVEPGLRGKKAKVVFIEVKLSKKWDRSWNKAMLNIRETGKLQINHMIGVYTGKEILTFDGIQVLPIEIFLTKLFNEEFF